MTTTQVQHTIPRTVGTTRRLPGPSDEAAWTDPATFDRIAHGGLITVQVWPCCGQMLGEVHNCAENWVR